MSAPKVLSGARCVVQIVDPQTGQARTVGIFNNVSYGVNYNVSPAFILGRWTAAELDYTSVDPVSVTCSGWRVVGHGAHADGKLPNVRDLLFHQYLTLAIYDRQSGKNVATINSCRPTGYSSTISARNTVEISMTYTGILCDDESETNTESVGSADLPPTA